MLWEQKKRDRTPSIRATTLRSLVLALCANACAPCELTSSISDFDPDCSQAVARQYETETRVVLPDEERSLLIYLPGDVEIGTRYGGTTGNAVTFLLGTELAIAAGSTVTLDTLDGEVVTGSLLVQFDSGDLEGTFSGVVSPPESR